MKLEYHPGIQGDFNAAVSHYGAQGGFHLADRFEAEFHICILAIKAYPTRFPFYQKSPDFRRVLLKNFPYLIVYREKSDGLRILLLKHERRHPLYGSQRK